MEQNETIYVCQDCEQYLLLDQILTDVSFPGDSESPAETYDYCPLCHGQNEFPKADVYKILRILNNEYNADGEQ
jgi:hypothetical protein